jgi:hypothetical protein
MGLSIPDREEKDGNGSSLSHLPGSTCLAARPCPLDSRAWKRLLVVHLIGDGEESGNTKVGVELSAMRGLGAPEPKSGRPTNDGMMQFYY